MATRDAGPVTVSRRAAVQRLKRRLKADDMLLRKIRRTDRFQVIDLRTNKVVAGRIDLPTLAHRVGVLQRWESLAKE